MKRITWDERKAGDCFFSDLTSIIGEGIRLAELALHPNAPQDFIPSHAGIIGFNQTVIEAWLDLSENSVAAVNPDSKYAPYAAQGMVEVWRVEHTPWTVLCEALQAYMSEYGPLSYGALNLIGFEYEALMKKITGVDVGNPIKVSDVCSQGVAIFLSRYAQECQLTEAEIDKMDPLGLRLQFLGIP